MLGVVEAQLIEAILAGVHLVVECEERFLEPGSLLILAGRHRFEPIVIDVEKVAIVFFLLLATVSILDAEQIPR